MNRKTSARPKACRMTAVDIRPRTSTSPQGHREDRTIAPPTGKKHLEMTSNDLRAFGQALFVAPAPAPNAALINIMKQAKAWS